MGFSRVRYSQQGEPRFTAYYWDMRGRARSAGTFSRRRVADRAWRRAEAEILRGRCVDLAGGRQAFRAYVTEVWLPQHVMEINTRQGYEYTIRKYLLPGFGAMRMNEIVPAHVRDFLRGLREAGVSMHALARCKTVLSSIFTTALNDQIIYLHPCTGVTTPVAPRRPLQILSPEDFAGIVSALRVPRWQLFAELAVETGLRWGELAELRVGDLHQSTRVLTVSRTVVELHAPDADGRRFVIKQYPKNSEYRQLHISTALLTLVAEHIATAALDAADLLFQYDTASAGRVPRESVDAAEQATDGWHGTCAYHRGCRCTVCRGAYAAYRRRRRAKGQDRPARGRVCDTDGHLPRDWFRKRVWYPAVAEAGIGRRVHIHDLRHTNASWMLAGGADLETVRERLGHRSLRATERYLHTLPNTGDKALAALHNVRTRS